MAKPDTLIIDGHAYRWQELCELRRRQLEAWKATEARQLALFELKEDCRPSSERTASGRFQEPSLFANIGDGRGMSASQLPISGMPPDQP
jgi:hypothetical protein